MANSEDKKITRSKAGSDATSNSPETTNSELDTSNLPTVEALKARFKAGSIPLESDFAALIDLANIGRLSLQNFLPKGSVIMFSGTEADIPEGWALCDGSKGTPNLVGKFIKAAKKPSGYSSGNYGGVSTINYQPSGTIDVKGHALSIDEMPKHCHEFLAIKQSSGFRDEYLPLVINNTSDLIATMRTDYNGSNSDKTTEHNHQATFKGNSSNLTIDPEHYEIAFIMKL
ncbi:hypothetical protein [Enterobacter kobei]|uniref:hypothetical protein n=1 Tax=Enterobacter kobei TaxID=208224 RepID=UPI003CED452F